MSVVVAIKSNKTIYMGADSQVTKGWTRTSLSNPNNYKIFRPKGIDHCLIGTCGALADSILIRVQENLVPEIDILKDTVDFDCVVKNVLPKLFSILDGAGMTLTREGIKYLRSEFLFAYKDKLFIIESDKSVIEVDDYAAIGSGSEPALGSLLTSETSIKPKDRIKTAITASATNDIYVDYPIILTDTDSTSFEIITEKDLK